MYKTMFAHRHTESLPGRALIIALATSPYFYPLEVSNLLRKVTVCPDVISVKSRCNQEYVQFFYDPYHVELESEQSWPLERLVNY
jgi:hypothetical protein